LKSAPTANNAWLLSVVFAVSFQRTAPAYRLKARNII